MVAKVEIHVPRPAQVLAGERPVDHEYRGSPPPPMKLRHPVDVRGSATAGRHSTAGLIMANCSPLRAASIVPYGAS